MTTNESFERRLSDWLDETSEHRVPEHLGEVLLQTVATRQRPGWSSLERWLPVTTLVRGRLTTGRSSLVPIAVALLLLALAAAAIFAVGLSNQKLPIRGYGANGAIFIADGTSLVSVSATGTGRQDVISLPAGATDLAMSPDGARLAFRAVSTAGQIAVLTLGQKTAVSIPIAGMTRVAGPIRWSPLGDRLAFIAADARGDHLVIAAADGSATRSLDLGGQGGLDLWYPTWSPDGAWVAYVGAPSGAAMGNIYLIHPDGSGYQALKASTAETGDGGTLAWSPDATVEQLLFVDASRNIKSFDVASGKERPIASGFWPTWSPSGDRISYWNEGTEVSTTRLGTGQRPVHPYPAFTGNCPDHPELARKVFCGPAAWSPDGTRLLATDISGTVILSLLADGTGSPIVIDLNTAADGPWTNVVWQPVRG
jgi:WD40 repeat protein